jgi:hypothetical protein
MMGVMHAGSREAENGNILERLMSGYRSQQLPMMPIHSSEKVGKNEKNVMMIFLTSVLASRQEMSEANRYH